MGLRQLVGGFAQLALEALAQRRRLAIEGEQRVVQELPLLVQQLAPGLQELEVRTQAQQRALGRGQRDPTHRGRSRK